MNKTKIVFEILALLGILILNTVPASADLRDMSTDAIDAPIINTTYVKFDENFGVHLLTVNISVLHDGKLVYSENYYGIDSHGKPRFYSSGTRYDMGNVSGKVSINIQRPRHRYGGAYSLIEKVIIINGERTTLWIEYSQYW